MYSRNTWGGPVEPFILVKFLNSTAQEQKDPIASLVIFEWKDKNFIGIPDPDTHATVRASPSSAWFINSDPSHSGLVSVMMTLSNKAIATPPIRVNSLLAITQAKSPAA